MSHLSRPLFPRSCRVAASVQIAALSLLVASTASASVMAPSPKIGAAASASSARGLALLKTTEAKINAAKTLSFSSKISMLGIPGSAPDSTTLTLTKQRPDLLACTLTQSGKEIGRIISTPSGGYVYDDAGNRYVKLEKSDVPAEALSKILTACIAVLPPEKLISLSLITSFVTGDHPFLIQMPSSAKIPVRVRSYTGSLNGSPVNHVTQSMQMGKMAMAMTMHLYTSPTTSLPERFAVTSVYGGKSGGVQIDFSNFQLGDASLPADTFSITPPATATAYTPPANPQSQEKPILAAGSAAPDFAVQDVAGKTIHLADFAGKVVVLDFWSTWCGPCQESLPDTDKLAKSYKSKGVVFLPICSWDDKSAFTPWVKNRLKWAMTFYFDPNGRGDKSIAGTLYNVSGIPTQFVIGKDGKVKDGFVGYDGAEGEKKLGAAIDKALAES